MMSYIRSLYPYTYSSFWDFPQTTWDPYFDGLMESDFFAPSMYSAFSLRPKPGVKSDGPKHDKGDFSVHINVSHFKPEEVDVRMKDNYVEIHGKHEERSDEHGFIQREFTRRYAIPNTIDSEKLSVKLRPDGIMIVEAPKKAIEVVAPNERIIPVSMLRPASEVEVRQK